MALWIESAVTFDKIMPDGAVKKTTEKNLFDALSFTEAEARTIEELTPYISGEFSIKAVKKTKIADIFFDESADKFYLACIAFVTIDEKSATEKLTATQILVQAGDFDSAVAALKEGMKGTLADWEITSVSEAPYMGVYPANYERESN